MVCFWVLLSENQDASAQIDNDISEAIKNANKISMAKNLFSNNRVETTVTAENTSFKRNAVDIWPHYGYFGQQPCNFGIDKDNRRIQIFTLTRTGKITKKYFTEITLSLVR